MRITAIKERCSTVFFGVLLFQVLCFLLDLQIPRGYDEWILYFFSFFPIRNSGLPQIMLSSISGTMLMVAGFAFSPRGDTTLMVSIVNRFTGLCAFWVVHFTLVSRYKLQKEQRQNEKKILQSEHKFRTLADSMPQLVWTANPDGTVDYYNERYHDFGGISAGPDGVWDWGPTLYHNDLQRTIDAWNRSVETGNVYQIEHRIKHADGTFHWYLSRGVPVRDENGHIVKWYGTATNIDISKKAQCRIAQSEKRLKILNENLEDIVVQRTQQVRALSKALTLAEQRERKRFSYILHENLQQLLLSAKILFNQHLRDLDTVQYADEYNTVLEGLGILDKALKTTKVLSIELNPPILRTQGLDIALQWLISHMQKQYHLQVDLHMRGPIHSIQNETQLMLTQMVRELLNNVIQHAEVPDACVEAITENKQVKITVSDRGKGFNPQTAFTERGEEIRLGLFSIRQRLTLFGGDLIINSTIGRGTTCVISLPL